jgi:hypothetical protein
MRRSRGREARGGLLDQKTLVSSRNPSHHGLSNVARSLDENLSFGCSKIPRPLIERGVAGPAHVVQLLQQPMVNVDGVAERIEQPLVMTLFPCTIPLGSQRRRSGGDSRGMRERDARIRADRRHPRISQASVGHGEQPGYFFPRHGYDLQPAVAVPLGERQGEALRSDGLEGG